MAFNGSGSFVRLYNWVQDRINGIKIRADRMDAEMDGMATGLSNTICRDGQSTTTAAIPFAQGIQTDDIDEESAAAGVTIDSVLLKDGRVDWSKASNVASTATTSLVDIDGNYVVITGTNTITGLGTAAAGVTRLVRFSGSLTLTHNATSLILGTGANRTTADGDVAAFVSEGSGNWRELFYSDLSEIQTSYQPLDADLTALAGLTSAANKVPYFTGSEAAGLLDFVDEDNMSSDSATAVASQQSIKAYVDSNPLSTEEQVEVIAISSNTASWTAAAAMDADYVYFLRCFLIPATDDVDLYLRTNTDAGAGNYAWVQHGMKTNGTAADGGSSSATQMELRHLASAGNGWGNGATEGVAIDVKIHPADGTRYDTFLWHAAGYQAGADFTSINGMGSRLSATAGKKPTLLFASGDIAYAEGVLTRIKRTS